MIKKKRFLICAKKDGTMIAKVYKASNKIEASSLAHDEYGIPFINEISHEDPNGFISIEEVYNPILEESLIDD